MLMFGHLVVSSVDDNPASLSGEWVRLVRQQWGYDGVLITDDLSMLEDSGDDAYQNFSTNALRAIAAGMDLIIDAGGRNRTDAMNRVDEAVATIAEAVESGGISVTQIDASAIRVAQLRYSLGGVSRPLEDAEAG
jgi:beta-N-acetylhexosaminidase